MDESRPYMTPKEIAKVLHMSERTVYGRVLQPGSGLPYHQIGRRKVVGREAFHRWLNGVSA